MGNRRWGWTVDGRQASYGTVERTYTDSGERTAESAGEVLDWLANGPGSPIWDNLDPNEPLTITVTPPQSP